MQNRNCANFPVLGFYCRYADDNENGRSRVVQLQLSDHTGYCTLIRPHRMERIPDSLRVSLQIRQVIHESFTFIAYVLSSNYSPTGASSRPTS